MDAASPHPFSKTVFGFWAFILSDCLLFAALFATYAVLRKETAGGPAAADILPLSNGLIQSLALLVCSFLFVPLFAAAQNGRKGQTAGYLLLILILATLFATLLFTDYATLVTQGHSWQVSGFLSALFNLIFTFAFHVGVGLLWIIFVLLLLAFRPLNSHALRRLACLKMFWHFLNILWVLIFTFVYLAGAVHA
jgi:cytochrome o ubiquinol oxidase subunit 3